MNKASERYNTRVEIPVSVLLETIFSDDNEDVETLSRWVHKYGFVDLIKDGTTKYGYYKLQDDYTKQSFYVLLDKEERKQYDYENYLCDENDKLQQKVNQLEKENQELSEKMIDKKYEILEFIKENKVKRYRVTLSEDYDEEILLDEDDIDTLERIVKNEYDCENK